MVDETIHILEQCVGAIAKEVSRIFAHPLLQYLNDPLFADLQRHLFVLSMENITVKVVVSVAVAVAAVVAAVVWFGCDAIVSVLLFTTSHRPANILVNQNSQQIGRRRVSAIGDQEFRCEFLNCIVDTTCTVQQ
jgi:hypothetical protein